MSKDKHFIVMLLLLLLAGYLFGVAIRVRYQVPKAKSTVSRNLEIPGYNLWMG